MSAASCHWPLASGFCAFPNLNSPYMPILRPSSGEGRRPKMSRLAVLVGAGLCGVSWVTCVESAGAGGAAGAPGAAGAGGGAGAGAAFTASSCCLRLLISSSSACSFWLISSGVTARASVAGATVRTPSNPIATSLRRLSLAMRSSLCEAGGLACERARPAPLDSVSLRTAYALQSRLRRPPLARSRPHHQSREHQQQGQAGRGGEGLLEAEIVERVQVGHGGVNPMITASESTEHTSRGIITGPPLASMPIRALRWCTSRPPSRVECQDPRCLVARCRSESGSVAGWMNCCYLVRMSLSALVMWSRYSIPWCTMTISRRPLKRSALWMRGDDERDPPAGDSPSLPFTAAAPGRPPCCALPRRERRPCDSTRRSPCPRHRPVTRPAPSGRPRPPWPRCVARRCRG